MQHAEAMFYGPSRMMQNLPFVRQRDDNCQGNTIIFSVALFDKDFIEARKDAFKSAQHTSLFDRFGVSAENFSIRHELLGAAS